MPFEIKKIGDITEICAKNGNIPKKIVLELSDDEKFYKTRLYYDFYNKLTNKIYPGYITCCSKSISSFVYDFEIVPILDDKGTIFTLTIPNEEE